MRIEEDIKLDFKDVLIRPKRSTLASRSQVDLLRGFVTHHGQQDLNGIPVIAANMDGVGTLAMARALAERHMFTALHKHYALEDLFAAFDGSEALAAYTFYSTGMLAADMEKLDAFMARMGNRATKICLDVANGYSQAFIDCVRRLRDRYPDKVLMAGNVVTGEMVEELILSGTDIVKIGIGPGSVCTTRNKTGVGYPQLSAIIECADAAHGLKGHVCADGGCQVPGDIAKAFGAGADFVMLGGMLSGHDEAEMPVVEKDGKRFLEFYGMSSAQAMGKHAGGVAEYRASEGKSVLTAYKGPVAATAQDILGGLRSACTYVGAGRLKELSKRTTFVRVSQQTNPLFN